MRRLEDIFFVGEIFELPNKGLTGTGSDSEFFWRKSGAAFLTILPQFLDLQEVAANS
uniref:hypothetical protein n=1 Tax=Candidatus Cryptobacteroides bacterium TaxID=3085639 RepID=UPI00402A1AAF